MSPEWRWRDAERSLADLRDHPADRRHLLLLARLPLAPPRLIRQLDGAAGDASMYRSLARLETAGLMAARRVPLRPGSAPRLLYLTDLGLAAVALDQNVDAREVARVNRLRTADLLALLPGLPHLLACYELLGLLASSRPGHPNLLAWERPWRRRCARPDRTRSIAASLAAYAALAWNVSQGAFLLLPDLGTYPVHLHRPSLRRVLTLRRHLGADFPPLLIATTGADRAGIWRELLDDVARDGRDLPLRARVATWETASADLAAPWSNGEPTEQDPFRLPANQVRPRREPHSPARRVARLVHDGLKPSGAMGGVSTLGQAVTSLTPEDHQILDLIGHHPFLTQRAAGAILGWTQVHARNRFRHLIELGLVRLVDPSEIGSQQEEAELAELTRDGLRLAASWQGLSLAQAIREEGLVGGGPTEPVGGRRQLVTNLQHTVGVDRVFVALIAAVRSRGGALLTWRNPAACARGRVRLDGYGLISLNGHQLGFFLEYDRGTMGERALRTKLAAYDDYRANGRYRRDYVGFPSILFVAAGNAVEERIARAARAVVVGMPGQLPVLLTTVWRLFGNPANPDGPLGAIWRPPDRIFDERQAWPPAGLAPGRGTSADEGDPMTSSPLQSGGDGIGVGRRREVVTRILSPPGERAIDQMIYRGHEAVSAVPRSAALGSPAGGGGRPRDGPRRRPRNRARTTERITGDDRVNHKEE